MMLNSKPASAQALATITAETPPVIISNFGKGLTSVRSALGPPAPYVIVRKLVWAPKLLVLPATAPPRNGLFVSILMHSAFVPVLAVLPILLPAHVFIPADDCSDSRPSADLQPIFLPLFAKAPNVDSSAETNGADGAATKRSISIPLKPDYAASQEIISNPPGAVPGIQTIRRPDLVKPPNMTYPLRLPSMVVHPVPALRAPAAPSLEHTSPAGQPDALALAPNQPAPPKPRLSFDARGSSAAPRKRDVAKAANISEPDLQASNTTRDPAAKSVVVINAVVVPPKPDLVIPDSELKSRFVLGPSTEATAGTEPRTNGSVKVARVSNRGADLSESNAESGPRDRSSSSNNKVTGGEKYGVPGISISGGVSSRSGRAIATSSIPRGSYALTIISSGNSGGASRDLGVFARTDTVYTIYIPMNDVGGGPAWSMQYALASSAQSASPNELPTPPVVLKKVPATLPASYKTANSGPVFVAGVIDQDGRLQDLRAVRAMDAKAQAAISSLAQWEFQPAQLSGKPVPSKILIGVNVMPAEEGGAPR